MLISQDDARLTANNANHGAQENVAYIEHYY